MATGRKPSHSRLLLRSALIEIDHFQLGEEVLRGRTEFPFTHSRVFDPAKRGVHFGTDGGSIDVNNAALQVLGRVHHATGAAAED